MTNKLGVISFIEAKVDYLSPVLYIIYIIYQVYLFERYIPMIILLSQYL